MRAVGFIVGGGRDLQQALQLVALPLLPFELILEERDLPASWPLA
jgi:hypothetical protein